VQVLSSVAILLTVVYNRPKIALMAAGIRFAAILVFGPFLIVRWGSLGGCFAVLAASTIYSVYLTWRMQGVLTYSLKKWALAIALGLIFLPLLWLQSSWSVNIILYGIFVIGYSILLLLLRFITLSEMVAVWRAFHSKNEISNWSKSVGKEHLDR
jgi:hypothetical protein